jgi:hypothetical protein
MSELQFARFESVPIVNGQLILDPWPKTVRTVKFGAEGSTASRTSSEEFALKGQVVEFFEYVRAVPAGEIRCLDVRHGLPFSMEVEHRPAARGVSRG